MQLEEKQARTAHVFDVVADALARLRSKHLEDIKQHEVEDGLWLNVNVLFSRAQCPSW